MGMYTRRTPLALIAPFVLVSGLVAGAQTYRGGIAGTVEDSSGAAVPQAHVVLTNPDTGYTREMESTKSGDYTFQDLQPSNSYVITVTAPGFGTVKVEKISVRPGQLFSLDPKLGVSASSDSVEVNAAALQIDTVSSTNNNVVNEKAVANIPLNGRDFTQLIKITPGVNGAGSVNGTRTNQNNYQIDGADSNDIWQNGTAANQGGVGPIAGVTIPVESIDQFTVQSSGNAEAGRNPGGLISLGIKTGTNSFHGSAYYYTRNEFFAARDFFQADNTRKQKVRNQQFGGSLGGPILKDKLLFFVNYERQKYVIQVPSNSATEPGAAYVSLATSLLQNHGFSVNPLSTTLLSALWMGGNAQGLAATQNNYVEAHPRVGYSDNVMANLNYILTPKQSLRLQSFVGTGRQVEPGGNTYWYFQAAPDITQSFSLAHNWAISDHFSNQLLVAVGIFNQTFNDQNHSFNMPALGLNTGVTSSSLFGAPTINMGAFDGPGATPPLGRKDYTGHITDAATWVTGKHQYRFGGEFRRNYMDLQYQRNARGTFNFPGTVSANITLGAGQTAYTSSGSTATVCKGEAICGGKDDTALIGSQTEVLALADFLVGNYTTASFLQGNVRRDLYRTDLAFFFQDAYKAQSNLTLNYGVRYDYTGAISSTGPLSVWRPGDSRADANGLMLVGNSGQPSLYNPGKLHFSPRVGFNYNPTQSLVVRGNYGIYFDAPPFNGFGDSNPGFTGISARGVQGNPVGGVLALSLGTGQWQKDQYVWSNASGPSTFGLYSVDKNLHMAYANNFNLATEYQISPRNVFTLQYAGSTGVHLYLMRDANQAAPGVGTSSSALQGRRPYHIAYPLVGAVSQVSSNAASNYHSLQASLKTSNFHGITSQISWTYGHALDNGSGFRSTGPTDSNNLRLDYGNAGFDVRHTVNGYIVYEIPGSHVVPVLSKGWQVTGFLTAYTSSPFSLTVGDNRGVGMNKDRANYSGGTYKTGSSSITYRANSTTKIVQYWVAKASSPFSVPTFGTQGNTARNQFRGPGFFTFDASLVKDTQLREGVKLQLRAEMFNLFNHMNMNTPDTGVTSSTFGQVTSGSYATAISSGAPFNVQFAGKLIF